MSDISRIAKEYALKEFYETHSCRYYDPKTADEHDKRDYRNAYSRKYNELATERKNTKIRQTCDLIGSVLKEACEKNGFRINRSNEISIHWSYKDQLAKRIAEKFVKTLEEQYNIIGVKVKKTASMNAFNLFDLSNMSIKIDEGGNADEETVLTEE